MKTNLDIQLFVGKISFVDIETGYWTLSNSQYNYRISNISEELKKENLKIAAIVSVNGEEMSIYMTEPAISILDYQILK